MYLANLRVSQQVLGKCGGQRVSSKNSRHGAKISKRSDSASTRGLKKAKFPEPRAYRETNPVISRMGE